MGIQEIAVFAVVLIAAVFAVKKFVGQFTQTDSNETCGKCELNKAVSEKRS